MTVLKFRDDLSSEERDLLQLATCGAGIATSKGRGWTLLHDRGKRYVLEANSLAPDYASRVISAFTAEGPDQYVIWRRISTGGYSFEQDVPCRVVSVSPTRVRVQPIAQGGEDSTTRRARAVPYERVRAMRIDEASAWGVL